MPCCQHLSSFAQNMYQCLNLEVQPPKKHPSSVATASWWRMKLYICVDNELLCAIRYCTHDVTTVKFNNFWPHAPPSHGLWSIQCNPFRSDHIAATISRGSNRTNLPIWWTTNGECSSIYFYYVTNPEHILIRGFPQWDQCPWWIWDYPWSIVNEIIKFLWWHAIWQCTSPPSPQNAIVSTSWKA